MLDALERVGGSTRPQRQLVADASHELRTPITSLRTNVEILRRVADLRAERRERCSTTVVEQTEELTVLMNDVIELARGDHMPESREQVRVRRIVSEARCPRRAATRRTPRSRPTSRDDRARGAPSRLTRAVNNLLDNAVSGPPGTAGRGHAARRHAARPRPWRRDPRGRLDDVFDRFFRGAHTREQTGLRARPRDRPPGRRGPRRHGDAANAVDGGAIFSLTLPRAPQPPEAERHSAADAPASTAS